MKTILRPNIIHHGKITLKINKKIEERLGRIDSPHNMNCIRIGLRYNSKNCKIR